MDNNAQESLSEKILAYQVIQYLQHLKERHSSSLSSSLSPSLSLSLDSACQQIENIFSFSSSDSNSFRELSFFPVTLEDLVEAGVEKLGAESYGVKVEKMSANPKFPVFVETVAKRGYFDGAEEGSVEYLKRHAKVVAKCQTK